jgi:hypothetical protein
MLKSVNYRNVETGETVKTVETIEIVVDFFHSFGITIRRF